MRKGKCAGVSLLVRGASGHLAFLPPGARNLAPPTWKYVSLFVLGSRVSYVTTFSPGWMTSVGRSATKDRMTGRPSRERGFINDIENPGKWAPWETPREGKPVRDYRAMLLIVVFSFAMPLVYGKEKPKPVPGSSGASSTAQFSVNQDYCDQRGPYSYEKNKATPLDEGKGDPPANPIGDLTKFTDDGKPILTDPSAPSQLMSDGSDASRLLVRAFAAGTCISIKISPNNASVKTGGTLQFQSLVSGTNKKDVVWTATAGSFKDGTYQAPPEVPATNPVTITATSKEYNMSASAKITITSDDGTAPSSSTQIEDRTASDFSLTKATYYVINIVQWKRQGSPPSYQVASNEWYLFNTTDSSVAHQTPFGRFSPNVSADTRIFGSKNIGFLAIHLRPSDVTQEEFRALQIAYDLQVQETQAVNVQDLMALFSLVTGIGVGAPPTKAAKLPKPPPPIGLWGGGLVSGLDAKMLPFNITFQANVKFQTGGGSPGKPPPATPAAAAGGAAPDQTTNTHAQGRVSVELRFNN